MKRAILSIVMSFVLVSGLLSLAACAVEQKSAKIDEPIAAKKSDETALQSVMTEESESLQGGAIIESGTAGTSRYELDSLGTLTFYPGEYKPTELKVSDANKDKVTKVVFKAEGNNKVVVREYEDFVIAGGTCNLELSRFKNMVSCDVSGVDTSQAKNFDYMFYDCSSLKSLDLSSFDTSNVTTMSYMFSGCYSINSLNLTSFNTSNLVSMGYMFHGCRSLESINLSAFDTPKAGYMEGMFYDCPSLTSLDLSSFNTSKVTHMWNMFAGCTKLETVYVSDKWSTDSFKESFSMFSSCISLVGGNGTKFNPNADNKTYARIDKPGQPGYFTYKSFSTKDHHDS